MIRKELLELRDKIMAEVVAIGKRCMSGMAINPMTQGQLVFLTMLHGTVVNQLKAMQEDDGRAAVVVYLDDCLGLLTDVAQGGKPFHEVEPRLRAHLHAALAYLEG